MIDTLTIERFKSIRSLTIPCRKVNVFIGGPDTGKTNILDALYFLSRLGWGLPLDSSLRVRKELGIEALFYRQFFDAPCRILLHLDAPAAATMPTREVRLQATVNSVNRALDVELQPLSERFALGFGDAHHWPGLDWIRFYA